MDMNNTDQYSLPHLRHLMAARTHFPVTTQPSDTFLFQRNMAPQPQYEHIMVGTEFLPYVSYDHSSAVNNVTTTATTPASVAAANSASAPVDIDQGIWAANDGGNSRWPRQETLILLQIRSRLDSKFKEANQKGPLWDQVSRIMAEEHGYQRNGKKCREKFENLYKYYKKTKEGKAGRHDGKQYRFFRQLEAICGAEASNKNNNQTSAGGSATQPYLNYQYPGRNILKQESQDDIKLCESTLSFSTTSEFETSSCGNNEDELSAIAFMVKKSMDNKKMSVEKGNQYKRGKKSWTEKVKHFVDSQMRKIMENQDAWMQKALKAIEEKEQERIHKEEEWRKQEEAKFTREHEFWASKRAWLEARDAALMEALNKFTGKGLQLLLSTEAMARTRENNSEKICINDNVGTNRPSWTEPEFSTLLRLRSSMDFKYHESEYIKEGIWEEISAKMATESNKKHKKETKTSYNFQHNNVFIGNDEASNQNKHVEGIRFQQLNDNGVASSSYGHQNSSFQIMMNNSGHCWRNCDLSLNKEKNLHS